MKNIVKRPYRELCDFTKVYDFMVKNYAVDCRIIRQLLNNDNVVGNKRKKDLSVSRVLLKSFLRNT